RRAKEGGLDGVEISADHQHLIDQFWSPRTNKRTDGYGGSFENRMRFGLEVLEEVRKYADDNFIIGLRMSGDEFHPDGLGQEDLLRVAKFYDDSGLIDLLSVTGSGADTHATIANCMPNMAYPPEPFLYLASGIKAEVKVPLIHAQGIRDPMAAARIIDEGHVDLVGITRGHIADPHFVNKMKEGRLDEIKQCVGANYCIDRQYQGIDVLCVQNAATSREQTMPHLIAKAPASKRVVVVGGGPAGMEAARVCAERGHEVVLFEKNALLGGQITLAAKAPARDMIGGITRWFVMELKRLKVDVRLNSEADAAMIRDEAADIVILATGGTPFMDQFPEWKAAEGLSVSSHDILSGRVEPKQNVLVFDVTSTYAGVTCADYIANRGSLVEIVTPDLAVGEALGGTTLPVYNKRLGEKDVIYTPNTFLHEVYREGDKLVAVLESEYTGAQEERVVDQVVIENSVRPAEALYYELKDESRNRGQIDLDALFDNKPQPEPEQSGRFLMYRIGDCVSPRDIHGAIYEALRLCKDF
ncbi:MAG: FAD-dependent oxidoreductase, partial [Candidatus Competibacteraceae bacterium]|nr:FAD-dependent oxidoreductase [Candidatus Competibacteraceae bacterium]